MVFVLKTVSILGSTGSVGKNTLEVISKLSDKDLTDEEKAICLSYGRRFAELVSKMNS